MTESLLWSGSVRPQMISFGQLKRIEDLIEKGTPDVIYCLRWLDERAVMGWLELKKLREWPSRKETIIRLPHLTPEQVAFHERWGRAGAPCFLLAQVATDFLLFRWDVLRRVQAGLAWMEFTSLAVVHGRNKFPTRDILRCLTK